MSQNAYREPFEKKDEKLEEAPTALPIGMNIGSIVCSVSDISGAFKERLRYNRAVKRFNRTMRRHMRRATRLGLSSIAGNLAVIRNGGGFHAEANERLMRHNAKVSDERHWRFFYILAADACAKLAEANRALKEADALAAKQVGGEWGNVTFSFGTLRVVPTGALRFAPRMAY